MCLTLFKRWRIRSLTKKLPAMQQQRMTQQVSDELIQREIKIYHTLNQLYTKLRGKKRFPFASEMAIEMLRLAAQLHDQTAQYTLGIRFLEEAKWRASLEQEKTFSSQANQALATHLFAEAIAYLTAASTSHLLAKRMLGACYIFGWGVKPDNDQGLAMIVESITLENSWNKASQILTSLGLNRPEFFEALVKRRH